MININKYNTWWDNYAWILNNTERVSLPKCFSVMQNYPCFGLLKDSSCPILLKMSSVEIYGITPAAHEGVL